MRADNYELWIRLGIALKELGEAGRGLWMEWSATSKKYDPAEAAKKWDGFTPDRTDFRAVFAEAQRQGWVNPNSNDARALTGQSAGEVANELLALPAPKLRREALYGILGEIADAGSATTEAVPAALAMNTLTRFCAAIGDTAHVAIGDERRSLRPFVLIIGPTGVGRKGTSAQLPAKVFERAEMIMAERGFPQPPLRTETAVSSGQGLVFMVRDSMSDDDPGVPDKRVLLEVSEFAGALAQARQESSVLTAVLRDAFDGRRLTTPNKNNPCAATGAHFVVIGHITREELTTLLSKTDICNGFANRFMMVYSARNKRIAEPSPTPPEMVEYLADKLAAAIGATVHRGNQPVERSPSAKQRWRQLSEELENRARPDAVQKLMARASTYVWMLSAAIALINREAVVEPYHLDAAMAWVDYWEDTANFCFTTAERYDAMLLAQTVSDEIVAAVKQLGGKNVPHAAVTDLLTKSGKRKNRDAKVVLSAVAYLQNEAPPRIEIGRAPGRGRTATTYTLTGG
jgi:putative DNA primase/helicase